MPFVRLVGGDNVEDVEVSFGMKTLLVLRHAKSSWADSALGDHERPLNERGRRDAPRMGDLIREYELIPDFVISSDASRAQLTAQAVAEAARYAGESCWTRVSTSQPADILLLLRTVREDAETIMIVGQPRSKNGRATDRRTAGHAYRPSRRLSCRRSLARSQTVDRGTLEVLAPWGTDIVRRVNQTRWSPRIPRSREREVTRCEAIQSGGGLVLRCRLRQEGARWSHHAVTPARSPQFRGVDGSASQPIADADRKAHVQPSRR